MRNIDKKRTVLEIDFIALRNAVELAVAAFIKNCPDANPNHKTGGVILHRCNRGVEQHTTVGTLSMQSVYEDLLTTARRKIEQLQIHFTHMTSYQSRDPEKGLWGGGLNLFCNGQVALSGLPELADEACLMCGLVQCDLVIIEPFVTKALKISDNTALYKRICKGICK